MTYRDVPKSLIRWHVAGTEAVGLLPEWAATVDDPLQVEVARRWLLEVARGVREALALLGPIEVES